MERRVFDEDRLNHALEIPRLAREEYLRLDRHMRTLCDAFAAGFNYYLSHHPEVRPRLLMRMGAVVHARVHPLQLLPERLRTRQKLTTERFANSCEGEWP